MSKISSCEKFFIGRIALGLENMGLAASQTDVEKLLSECLNRDEEFVKKIKNALTSVYSAEKDDCKRNSSSQNPSLLWDESVIKLAKGRETLLRDITVEWYASYIKPGFFEIIKDLFRKK